MTTLMITVLSALVLGATWEPRRHRRPSTDK